MNYQTSFSIEEQKKLRELESKLFKAYCFYEKTDPEKSKMYFEKWNKLTEIILGTQKDMIYFILSNRNKNGN